MKLLVDSDFLFAAFVEQDAHFKSASSIWVEQIKSKSQVSATNLVIQETATVLSYKIGQTASLKFLEKLPSLQLHIIKIDEELETKAWGIFKCQTKKGTSFVDCANLAVIRHFKLEGILSFDRFYPAKIRVST